MIKTASNVWATSRGTDVQRSDLWSIDFSHVLAYLASLPEEFYSGLGLVKSKLPTKTDLSYSASRISFPSTASSIVAHTRGTTPVNMPSYFGVDGLTTIDLRHAASDSIQTRVFLAAWKNLVNMGRQTQQAGEPYYLPDSRFKPQFKYDLKVTMLSPSDTGEGFELGSTYTIYGAWIQSFQLDKIDRRQAAAQLKTSLRLHSDSIS